MDLFRKGLRKGVKFLAGKKLIPAKTTFFLLHMIELLRIPDLKNPKDLNEKLMWLALNTDTSEWSRLSDKYEVRKFIASRGLGDILIPLSGVYDKVEEINFDEVPDAFVIKSTNGSAQNIIVKDKSKINTEAIIKEIVKWQKTKFGLASGEPHYLRIKPKLIIEKLLETKDHKLPVDYKFMCFNGKVHSCLVCSQRDDKTFVSKRNLFDVKTWQEITNSINPSYHGDISNTPKPLNLDKMVDIAKKISEGFPFVRVDLYNIEGKIYFGEMTFSPSGCRIASINHHTLSEMGKLIN